MVGQGLVQPVTREPADRDVDLRLAQKSPVMNDAKEKAREHQANGDLRVDPRPPRAIGSVEVANLGA